MNNSYLVTLADLIDIADAACELDVTKQFYIDRPDEQQRLTAIVNRLHDIVERAAGAQAAIYAPDDGSEKRRKAEAAACPCGRTPTAALQIADAGQGSKWATVAGDCCGEWMIEFRTNYAALDSDECKRLAREAWNSAPRAANTKVSGASDER